MPRSMVLHDALDATDRALLNILQDGIAPVARPFQPVADACGLDESEVIARIDRLRGIGAITRFGPFIDAAALGGAFCLCAMAVPEKRFDEIAGKINAYDEVAHNYARQHDLNMWFVLACETPEAIEKAADRIEKETRIKVLRFPKLKEFFIGFRVAV